MTTRSSTALATEPPSAFSCAGLLHRMLETEDIWFIQYVHQGDYISVGAYSIHNLSRGGQQEVHVYRIDDGTPFASHKISLETLDSVLWPEIEDRVREEPGKFSIDINGTTPERPITKISKKVFGWSGTQAEISIPSGALAMVDQNILRQILFGKQSNHLLRRIEFKHPLQSVVSVDTPAGKADTFILLTNGELFLLKPIPLWQTRNAEHGHAKAWLTRIAAINDPGRRPLALSVRMSFAEPRLDLETSTHISRSFQVTAIVTLDNGEKRHFLHQAGVLTIPAQ